MASNDRFYQVELSNRPAFMGDIGSYVTIAGVIFQANGQSLTLMLPNAEPLEGSLQPSIEEWSEIIQHSDDPSIFELDENGYVKAIHRKVRYQISGAIQQKIWALDGCKCLYCGRKIGEVQLTVDHFEPLETGGKNDQTNYITSCRKCNKNKGNESAQEWCSRNNVLFDYDWYVDYLKNRKKYV